MIEESKETIQLREELPRGISIGVFQDGRGKPFFVRYGDRRSLLSFVNEHERNVYAATLIKTFGKAARKHPRNDPLAAEQLHAFETRVGMSLAEVEEVLNRVKQLGLQVAQARAPGLPDKIIR
jgi:hypothetical protein